METPKDISPFINQLGRFIPNLATMTQPIFDLLTHDNNWIWGADQQKAFENIKQSLILLAHM